MLSTDQGGRWKINSVAKTENAPRCRLCRADGGDEFMHRRGCLIDDRTFMSTISLWAVFATDCMG